MSKFVCDKNVHKVFRCKRYSTVLDDNLHGDSTLIDKWNNTVYWYALATNKLCCFTFNRRRTVGAISKSELDERSILLHEVTEYSK